MRFIPGKAARPQFVQSLITEIVRALTLLGCGFAMSAQSAIAAANWPCWRGPTGVGVTDESKLPLTWDGKKGENVLWKTPLSKSTGHSSPIVWADKVFITTSDKQTRQQEEAKEIPEHHLECYRAGDGELVWRTLIPQGKEVAGYSIYASPTPATDGKAVFVWFGSAVIAAVDFDGKLLWRHERPGPFMLNPGLCSSLVLYGDTVILQCDQSRNQGYLQGLLKTNGEIKWEQRRTGFDNCNATPLLLDIQGKPQLIVTGSKALQGLQPEDGKLIWSCKAWGFGASPAWGDGLIYADRGGNEPAVAVDPTGAGDVTKTHLKWQVEKIPGDYSSPVVCNGRIYRATGEGVIECRSLANGEKLFTGRLDGVSKLASPVATADELVYFVSTGKSHVIKATPTLEIVGGGSLGGGGNGSSPAVSNGRIYVRDFDALYCIGEKK